MVKTAFQYKSQLDRSLLLDSNHMLLYSSIYIKINTQSDLKLLVALNSSPKIREKYLVFGLCFYFSSGKLYCKECIHSCDSNLRYTSMI